MIGPDGFLAAPHYGEIVSGLMLGHKLRPWEIARLTDRQIFDLYARPVDKEGKPLPMARPSVAELAAPKTPEDEKRQWMQMGRGLIRARLANFTEADLEAKWAEGEARRGKVTP